MSNKNKHSIYNIFYSSRNHRKGKENCNNILKGTKSILKSFSSFNNYIKKYTEITQRISFKRPDVDNFPILNSKSLSLLPISKSVSNVLNSKKIKTARERNRNIKKYNFPLSSDDIDNDKINNNFKFVFQNKIKLQLKTLEEKMENMKNIKKVSLESQNPIISDFFYKWTQKYNFDIKNPKGNKFSSLCYDDKKIFYTNYDDFLREKINYIKKHKMENLQEELKSEFFDTSGRKIKLELFSIKIIFKELDDNNIENDREQTINLPLSYVFLFYINGFIFFKKILLSSIYFSNNYTKINFTDEKIYTLIKKYFTNENDFKNIFYNEKKNTVTNFKRSIIKKDSQIFNSKIKLKKSMTINRNIETKKFTGKPMSLLNNKKLEIKRIKIFHVNREMQKKEKEKELMKDHNDKIELNYLKDNIYDEFIFLWETPNKTFKVIIQLPIITLWSELLNETIVTYCDKNLFLYMFKNNFINWDFYALHYFFSIKLFRKTIIQRFSYKTKNILRTAIRYKNTEFSDNNYFNNDNNKSENRKISSLMFNKILYIRNKRVNNFLNEKNESLLFFYTDIFNINSIIEFHSYSIFIDYNELNPTKEWQFFLNFKQMLYLTLINKFELLETFLPKIIKSNFEYGTLDIDFSVFNDFNANILNYTKKEVFNKYHSLDLDNNNKKNENMKIVIKKPYIKIEKMVEEINSTNINDEIELTNEMLNKMRKMGNNLLWTKIILKMIDEKKKENSGDDKSIKKTKDETSANDIDELIERNKSGKEIKRFSKSFHLKERPQNKEVNNK